MKAAVFYAPYDVRIEERDIPKYGKNDVLVKVRAAGICGTDVHIYSGNFDVPAPLIIGHNCSGVIEAVGDNVRDFRPGDRVMAEPVSSCGECFYCQTGRYNICSHRVLRGMERDGVFAEYAVVPSRHILKIPEKVSFEEAAAMEPTAVALHAMDFAKPSIGEYMAIIGQGPIGLFHTQIAKLCSLEVIAIDLIPYRLESAKKFRADYVINASKSDAVKEVVDLTGGGADIVLEASGSVNGVNLSTKLARPAGRIVIVGSSRELLEHGPPSEEILTKELTVYGVAGSASKYPIAMDLVAEGKIDVKSLITHRFSLGEIKKGLEISRRKDENVMMLLAIL